MCKLCYIFSQLWTKRLLLVSKNGSLSRSCMTKYARFRNINFRGATIRLLQDKHSIVLISHHQIFFRAPVQKSYWIIFNFFRGKAWKPNVKFESVRETRQIACFNFFFFYKPAFLQKNFYGRVLYIRVFSSDKTIECFFWGNIGW